jgi:hypothetical protein
VIDHRTSRQKAIDDSFYARLRAYGEDYDLMGKRLRYDDGGAGGRVDILCVDVEGQEVELIEVDTGGFTRLPAYESLVRDISQLGGWTYSAFSSSLEERPVDDSPPMDGKLYYRDEDIRLLESEEFREFSLEVFGRDILSEEERIDPESLGI